MAELPAEGGRWTVVVPAKSPQRGKSRLAAGPEWARALLLDTLDALLATPSVGRVILVTDDARAWEAPVGGPRVRIVPDPGSGLNPAVEAGLQAVPGAAGPVAIVLGDLPGLSAVELDAALAAAEGAGPLAVPDHDGSGTTMTFAARAGEHRPCFGAGSFHRHLQAGYAPAPVAPESSLRWDIDVPADVAPARLGPRTRALLLA